MIRLFKSPQPANMVILPLIIFLFWIRSSGHLEFSLKGGLPLWDGIVSFLAYLPVWVNFVILFLLICSQAIYLNLILNRHEVLYKNTFLPALIFVLFISATPQFMQIHPVHFVNLIFLRVLDRMFTLFKNEQPVSALFDTGFLSGIIGLLYLPGIIMLPLLFAALAVLRTFRIKEWLIMIIGFVLPFFFTSVYMFWMSSFRAFWSDYLGNFSDLKPVIDIHLNTSHLITAIFLGLIMLFSLLKLRANYRKNIIRTRSYQQIFFFFLLLGIASLMLIRSIRLIDIAFLIIPISVFCAYLYVSAKRRVLLYEYSLWLLVALMIWNQI